MKILVFDFETNGLLDKIDIQPIHFCSIIIDTTKNTKRIQETFIKYNKPLDLKIIESTGITDKKLKEEGIDYDLFLKGLNKIFDIKYDYIVGHNIINFDIPLAEKILNRKIDKNIIFDTAGQFKSELLAFDNKFNQSFYKFHSYILNIKRKGLFFNLEKAIKYYNIEEKTGNLHSAYTDVLYTVDIFFKQLEKINNGNN